MRFIRNQAIIERCAFSVTGLTVNYIVYDEAGNENEFYGVLEQITLKRDTIGPEPPILLSPTNFAQTTEEQPAHFWLEPNDPGANLIEEYHIQVATSDSFATTLVSATTTWISYVHQIDLPIGEYYWHIRGIDAAGNIGDWSATWSFQVVSIDTPKRNLPPTANAGRDIVVFIGEEVFFNGEGSSDPENDMLMYLWDMDGDLKPDRDGKKAIWWYFNNGSLDSFNRFVHGNHSDGFTVFWL